MAVVVKNLYAFKGTLNLPNRQVPIWGFRESPYSGPQIPGPAIEATVGDILRIRLYNYINERVSIIFPGQGNVFVIPRPGRPQIKAQPQYENGMMISYTNFTEPMAMNRYITYSFNASKPGVYLYEAGTNSDKQIQMGLYGTIIVRPVGFKNLNHPNYKTAYGADTNSSFDVESILVLGEIDTRMHDEVSENVYNNNMLNYKPDYWLINGRSYPDTVTNNRTIRCRVGDRLLLRIINAGYQTHSIFWGGMTGRIIGSDSFPLITSTNDISYEKNGITLAPGQSYDVALTPEEIGKYLIYDREYEHIVNNGKFPGGMIARFVVST